MVYTDRDRRQEFKKAVYKITRDKKPRWSQLRNIGRHAAKIARRRKPWSPSLIYNLINWSSEKDSYKRFGITPQLFNAVMKMAGMTALRGKRVVTVYASGVHENAIVFIKSRPCARWGCKVHIVADARRKYCSDECAARQAKVNRKKRVEEAKRRRQAGKRKTKAVRKVKRTTKRSTKKVTRRSKR